MSNTTEVSKSNVSGRVTFSLNGQILSQFSNSLQLDWVVMASKLFGFGDRNYRIRGMYLEYQNVALVTDVATVPTYTRADNLTYYQGLSGLGDVGYLRVPLASTPGMSVSAGLQSYLGTNAPVGNALTCMALTAGVAGVNGVPFTVGVNSKLFGAALIAAPDWDDPTQDLVFARAYAPVGLQVIVPLGSQIVTTWDVTFN
jgi:hypothetical protein